MKSLEVHLDYYKQGSDLQGFLGATGSISDALRAHADCLNDVATHLNHVVELIDKLGNKDVAIEACEYFIGIEANDKLADALLQAGLASEIECSEMECSP